MRSVRLSSDAEPLERALVEQPYLNVLKGSRAEVRNGAMTRTLLVGAAEEEAFKPSHSHCWKTQRLDGTVNGK